MMFDIWKPQGSFDLFHVNVSRRCRSIFLRPTGIKIQLLVDEGFNVGFAFARVSPKIFLLLG